MSSWIKLLDFTSGKKPEVSRNIVCNDVESWFLDRSEFGETCL